MNPAAPVTRIFKTFPCSFGRETRAEVYGPGVGAPVHERAESPTYRERCNGWIPAFALTPHQPQIRNQRPVLGGLFATDKTFRHTEFRAHKHVVEA